MIRLENVTKVYKGDVPALRGVNLEIKERICISSWSIRSGKSTFIRLLNREEVADSGKILLLKRAGSLRSWSVPALKKYRMHISGLQITGEKAVAENVAFALEVMSQPDRDQKTSSCHPRSGWTKPKAGRFPDELSGGEQQRVSIARALQIGQQSCLLMTTGNLDPATSVGIMKLLDLINRRGTTVVMATRSKHR